LSGALGTPAMSKPFCEYWRLLSARLVLYMVS
jgi:hypothetical protein